MCINVEIIITHTSLNIRTRHKHEHL